MRHFILGTAGHVDHGKTELVRALTGLDTDRLKEEKERGISIELGFAPLRLEDGTFIGIIDVPGHERFVKHMVAGAGGVDMAALLVAADEGVMPQTEEHMEVLTSLGIEHGLVVISKCDLASDDTMELLREEIAELTRGTFLENAPTVETSARTGHGIPELMRTLAGVASGIVERDATGPFRLAIDRVFHSKGIGVVITGSSYSGAVAPGDSLELLPGGRPVRVRDLQSFGERRERGLAGERLALALQGVKLGDVSRGDMLATPGAFAPTATIDARVELGDYSTFEVKNRERVRIHHGAREVMGRVILLEHDVVRAGDSVIGQLVLESPLVCAARDRFVLRKYSPPRVIGGGAVIDAHPDRHKRFDERALGGIKLKEKGEPEEVLAEAIRIAGLGGVDQGDVDADLASRLARDGRIVLVSGRWFARATIVALAEKVDDLASEYVAKNTLKWGIDKEELRQRTGFPYGSQAFNLMLDELANHRPVFVRGNRVRSGSPDMTLDDAREAMLAEVAEAVRERGPAFPSVDEVAERWRGSERLADAIQLLKDRGDLVGMGEAGIIHQDALQACLDTLRRLFSGSDRLGVGDFKEALGLSRKHAIPILEHFDGVGVTSRSGNHRVRGPGFPD